MPELLATAAIPASAQLPLATLWPEDWQLVEGPYCVVPFSEHARWLAVGTQWQAEMDALDASARAAARAALSSVSAASRRAARSEARTHGGAAGAAARYIGDNAVTQGKPAGQVDLFSGVSA